MYTRPSYHGIPFFFVQPPWNHLAGDPNAPTLVTLCLAKRPTRTNLQVPRFGDSSFRSFSPPGFNVSACSVQASPIKLDEDAKGSSTILASIKQERGSPSTAARPLKKTKPLPTSPLSVDLVHQDVVPDSPSLHSTPLSPSSFLALRERLCYQGHRSYTPSWYYQLSDFHGPSHGRGVPHLHQGWSSRRRLRRKG